MNINFNSNISSVNQTAAAGAAAPVASGVPPPKADLSITNAIGDPGDLPAIDFPEDENVARYDRLGELVKAAFNLPAPPPDFMSRV